jgi:hypothetical protein
MPTDGQNPLPTQSGPIRADPVLFSDASTKAVDRPKKAVDRPKKAVDRPTKAVDRPTKAVDRPTKAVDRPTKAADSPTKRVDRPTKTVKPSTVAMVVGTRCMKTPKSKMTSVTRGESARSGDLPGTGFAHLTGSEPLERLDLSLSAGGLSFTVRCLYNQTGRTENLLAASASFAWRAHPGRPHLFQNYWARTPEHADRAAIVLQRSWRYRFCCTFLR